LLIRGSYSTVVITTWSKILTQLETADRDALKSGKLHPCTWVCDVSNHRPAVDHRLRQESCERNFDITQCTLRCLLQSLLGTTLLQRLRSQDIVSDQKYTQYILQKQGIDGLQGFLQDYCSWPFKCNHYRGRKRVWNLNLSWS
jgi:hypothetical protein